MKNCIVLFFSVLLLSFLPACSKAPTPASSASPDVTQTPATSNRPVGQAHLKLTSFKVLMKHQGQTMTIRGDEQGKLTIGNGDQVESLQVYADGRLEGELMGGATCVLGPDGVLSFDNQASPLKVTENGDIHVKDQLFLRRDGDRYVEVKSRPGRSQIEFDVEGPAEGKRLMAYLVALSTYMLEGEAIDPEPEPEISGTP